MNELLSQWSWARSHYLLGMILLLPLVGLLFFDVRNLRKRLNFLRSTSHQGTWILSRPLLIIKGSLWFFVVTFMVLAAAGPRFGWEWTESKQNGMDMVVAVDVSKSMLAGDLNPSRLERARRLVIDLMEVAGGDRIGLVVFAGAAFVQCPLTVDHGALRVFLDQLNPDLVPVGGTDLAGALRESLKALDAGKEGKGEGKVILLISDGEDHLGQIDESISEVISSKAKVISVGMASKGGAPIRDASQSFVKDDQGNVVISRLDEKTLKDIATKTGGSYLAAEEISASAISSIYQTMIRSQGTVQELKTKREKLWYDRYQWPLAAALMLLILEGFLAGFRKNSGVLALLCVSVLVFSDQGSAASADQDKYNESVKQLEKGDEQKVLAILQDLAQSSSGEVKRRSLYNLANLLGAQGKLDEAVKLYEEALSMDYQDQQVRDNLAWAKKKKDQQNKDQQNKDQQNKDQQNKDQQNKDQQSKDQQNKDQQSKDQQNKDQQNKDQQNKDQQNKDQQNKDQQNKDQQAMTPEEAERLLRAAPDERKTLTPIYRGDKSLPRRVQKDW